MRIAWQKPLSKTLKVIFEEVGYHVFTDPMTRRVSYVMRLGRSYYPRFHLYVLKDASDVVELDFHLDQKPPYGRGYRAHAAEDTGQLVEEEAARLKRWFAHYS